MNLKGLYPEELESTFREIGQPAYRAKQAFLRVNAQRATSLEEFSEFPKALRSRLAGAGAFPVLAVTESTLSDDGTEKCIFQYAPADAKPSQRRLFEAVWLVSEERRTACISSQAGCSLNCRFCATGTLPFQGNLEAWMIIDQVYELMRRHAGDRLTNVVMMGMGEPLHNYDNVMRAADILHHPDGLNLGARHITISTAGVVPGIHRFIDEARPFNLAISLNASDAASRRVLMDVEERHPLGDLLDAARRYNRELHRTITFEYVMIPGSNMGPEDVRRLIALGRSLKCKFNLIPLNTNLQGWQRPTAEECLAFQEALRAGGLLAFNRGSPGRDIDGACGMLALRHAEDRPAD